MVSGWPDLSLLDRMASNQSITNPALRIRLIGLVESLDRIDCHIRTDWLID
jgi:hypothetical protein